MTQKEARKEGEKLALKQLANPDHRVCFGRGYTGRSQKTGCLIPCYCTGITAKSWAVTWKQTIQNVESDTRGVPDHSTTVIPGGCDHAGPSAG